MRIHRIPDMEKEFIQYITEGGFPLSVKYNTYDEKMTYVNSVIDEIYEKDVKSNKKIRKKALFQKVQTYIINNFGATTSVDSICEYLGKNADEYSYVQVARTIDNDNFDENGKNITEEREYRPLEKISDGYTKYLITMDKLLQRRSRVKHLNIIDMILDDNEFE